MAFTATRTATGQYHLINDVNGDHVTVDTAEDIKAFIDMYNKATDDKVTAEAEAAALLTAPVAVPTVDTVADPLAIVPSAPVAPAPGPVTNAN